jgi:putative transposase
VDYPADPQPSDGPGDRAADFCFLVRDRAGQFTDAFDDVFAGNSTQIIKTPVQAPRANAICERLAGTLRREAWTGP